MPYTKKAPKKQKKPKTIDDDITWGDVFSLALMVLVTPIAMILTLLLGIFYFIEYNPLSGFLCFVGAFLFHRALKEWTVIQ